MFIPNDKETSYKENDVVMLLNDLEISYGKFTKGHEFIISGKDGYGYIMKDIQYNITVIHINHTQISSIISPDKAKQLYINRINKIKFVVFCKKKCHHKYKSIDDREYYDACRLGKEYINECKPKLKCLKHIDNDDIKEDKFMFKYLRGLKLKKCLKKVT